MGPIATSSVRSGKKRKEEGKRQTGTDGLRTSHHGDRQAGESGEPVTILENNLWQFLPSRI